MMNRKAISICNDRMVFDLTAAHGVEWDCPDADLFLLHVQCYPNISHNTKEGILTALAVLQPSQMNLNACCSLLEIQGVD